MINKLSEEIHRNNIDKGFYDDEKNIGEMLALVHSEVSEALEADRINNYTTYGNLITHLDNGGDFKTGFEEHVKHTFEDELADIMIRVMDLAKYKNINLEWHIEQKMKYNSMREHKHGKKY